MSQSAKPDDPQDVPRRGRIAALGTDATRLAEGAIRRAGFPDLSLVLRWRQIAGADIADIAQPIRCRQGPGGLVLTLRCEPGAAVFLQHQTRALMERLNAFLGAGAVSRVTVVPGASAPSRPASPHPLGAIGQTAPEGADKSLAKALERLANLRARLGRRPARGGLD